MTYEYLLIAILAAVIFIAWEGWQMWKDGRK